ncbi:START domain-containing protein [Pseudomonas sp. MAFF 302030]|uniref:START domain-containing protein n=1 Tax=Pseudomonas morbosilactucae TaxID=2938197 RepID=A0A9X1Z1S7_9PSED|nr:START domain-containing protein [Pseudomonas morbosilactucae]MCK9802054.1 START domain-containing protein [Pseudomonas morbosilactucae]
MRIRSGTLALCMALLCTGAAAREDWQLAEDQDGVQVYLNQAPDSHYQRFRGVVQIRADVDTLNSLQENLRVACAWLYACKEMRLLKNDGDDTWVYLSTDLPWPAKPRDMVLWVHTERAADGSLTRHLQAVPGWVPGEPGQTRIRQLQGLWKMEPKGPGATEVTYELQAEPAGDIPAWLANRFVVDAPLVTLKTLRAVAERQASATAP